MLLLLGKDLLTFIFEMCIEYNEWNDINLNTLLQLTVVCKPINTIVQKIINKHKYTYNIYQISTERPDIVDIHDNTYTPEYTGNHIWFLSAQSVHNKFIFVDKEYYDFYDQSSRYFEENCTVLKGIINSQMTFCDVLHSAQCFTIHYKAEFGQILLLTWYNEYNHVHKHIKMSWTEGDVWIGIICEANYSFYYRYEVCVDNGGPIIRKEKDYRKNMKKELNIDVWDKPFLNFSI
jgi:hypothetical protein